MLPIAILAGGLATRLRPLTENIPKALVEVCGEPFVFHQLRLLHARGIGRVVLCLGYRGEMVQDAVGDGRQFGLEVAYSFDGPLLRGTAGAVRNALPLLGGSFFVLYGDSYLPCEYAAVERAFRESGKTGLMTVFRNEGQWDTSNVEFAGGRVLAYDKQAPTPRMRHIDYGLGAFRREAFGEDAQDLAAVYQRLLRQGQLAAREIEERFYEIGSLEGLEALRAFLRK